MSPAPAERHVRLGCALELTPRPCLHFPHRCPEGVGRLQNQCQALATEKRVTFEGIVKETSPEVRAFWREATRCAASGLMRTLIFTFSPSHRRTGSVCFSARSPRRGPRPGRASSACPALFPTLRTHGGVPHLIARPWLAALARLRASGRETA